MNTKTMDNEHQVLSDAERHTIAQQVAQLLLDDDESTPLVFILYSKETGVIRESGIEQMVKEIVQEHVALKAQRWKIANERNRCAVFDALAAQDVATLAVDFTSGAGAPIEIEVEVEDTPVTLHDVSEQGELARTETTLYEALQDVCSVILAEEWPGWDTFNDHVWGTFNFDIANRTVSMDDTGYEFDHMPYGH